MTRRVLFLPGASGAAELWAPVAGRMPQDWQTQLLSWPGAGEQPHDPAVGGYAALVELVSARISDRADLVAHSMGGAVALAVALAHANRVRRLVLVATSGGLDIARLGGSDWRADYEAEFPNAASWVTGDRLDVSGRLAAIEQSTCLIWGDNDPISPLAVGEQLASVLPHSELHVIRGGTHALAREQPDEVTKLIVNHLS